MAGVLVALRQVGPCLEPATWGPISVVGAVSGGPQPWVAGTAGRRFEAAAASKLWGLFDPLCGCGSSKRAGPAWPWGSLRLVEPWRGVGFREAGGSGSRHLARGPADPPSGNCRAS